MKNVLLVKHVMPLEQVVSVLMHAHIQLAIYGSDEVELASN
jgi:hypothetical protein